MPITMRIATRTRSPWWALLASVVAVAAQPDGVGAQALRGPAETAKNIMVQTNDVRCHLTMSHGTFSIPQGDRKLHNATEKAAYTPSDFFYCWLDEAEQDAGETTGAGQGASMSTVRKQRIELPRHFAAELGEQIHAHPVLDITNVREHGGRILLTDASRITVRTGSSHHRRLSKIEATVGDYNALVIRITDSLGNAPPDDLETMRGNILGIGSLAQSVNPLWQLEACSLGQLRITPLNTSSDYSNIDNGGVEVRLSMPIAGCDVTTWGDGGCEDEIVLAIEDAIGGSIDEIGFVYIALPTGGTFGSKVNWWAYGGEGQSYMMFQLDAYNYHSMLTHESGHRLGLGHSDWGSYPGDETCMMGPGDVVLGRPKLCFNAHKYWKLGWLPNTASYTPVAGTSGQTFRLVGALEANSPALSLVDLGVLEVGNLYIGYNRAIGANEDVGLFQNAVTISQGDPEFNYVSNHLAALVTNPTLYYWQVDYNPYSTVATLNSQFGSVTRSITIELCRRYQENELFKAEVSIYEAALGQTSTCGRPPNAATNGTGSATTTSDSPPTSTLTSMPILSPIPAPARPLTGNPTTTPTKLPTSRPTMLPSHAPTLQPTSTPTDMPTDAPQLRPSGTPTLSPSETPTGASTGAPMPMPTNLPTEALSTSLAPPWTSRPSMSPTKLPVPASVETTYMPPTAFPTEQKATALPSTAPSTAPVPAPTTTPITAPSVQPTRTPTWAPSGSPSAAPSAPPSNSPTSYPSTTPTAKPSAAPTTQPTATPTNLPTHAFSPGTSTAFPTKTIIAATVVTPAQVPEGDAPENGLVCNLMAIMGPSGTDVNYVGGDTTTEAFDPEVTIGNGGTAVNLTDSRSGFFCWVTQEFTDGFGTLPMTLDYPVDLPPEFVQANSAALFDNPVLDITNAKISNGRVVLSTEPPSVITIRPIRRG